MIEQPRSGYAMAPAMPGDNGSEAAALAASEAQYRLLIGSLAQAVWETDASGLVVDDSPSWRGYTGQTLQEWLGYGWLDAVHPDDRAFAERQWRDAVATGSLVNAEFRLRAPDGGWRWTNVRAAPVLDGEGDIEKWAGMNIDIDARKRAQAALAASEDKYRTLFQSIDEGFAVIEFLPSDDGKRPDFRFLEVNEAFERQTGNRHVAGRLGSEINPGNDAVWIEAFGAVARSGEATRFEIHHEDTVRWYDVFATRIGDAESRQVCVVFADISERKAREERQAFLLRVSDALRNEPDARAAGELAIRMLAEHLKVDRCYLADMSLAKGLGRVEIEYRAPELASIRGEYPYSEIPDCMRRLETGSLVVPDIETEPKMSDGDKASLEAVGFRAIIAVCLRRGEHDTVWTLATGGRTPRAWTSEEVRLVEEVAERTWAAMERARVEAALRESERLLSAMLNVIPVGLGMADCDGRMVLANPEWERFVPTKRLPSRDPEGSLRWRTWDEQGRAVPPSDYPGARALRGEQVTPPMEFLYTDDDGRELWTSVAAVPLRNVSDQIVGLVCIIQDIDEAKHAEDALRESEERLSLAIEVGQFASWDWDLRTGTVTWNDRHFIVQGYAVDQVVPSYEAWVARVHPEDRAGAIAAMEKARDTQSPYAHDFRTLHPDGTVRWCASRGRFFYDAVDGPYRMIGVMEDVTDRKLADNAIRESEERFQQFAKASSGAIWIRDAETLAMEYVSPAVAAIYGVEPDAFLGDIKQWAATIVPEDRETAFDHIEQARRGVSVVHEFRIQRPSDGAFRWVRNTDFPLNEDGHVTRIGGIAEDITEAKLAIEHQGVLLAELQHRVRNIMAILRSIAARTGESADSVEEYARLMAGRLNTFARVQALLTRAANAGVGLAAIVEAELKALAAHGDQFDLQGPDVELSPKAAETMTLAVHELTTNALKYGALSVPGGKVVVRWETIDRPGGRWLSFDWNESGVPRQPGSDTSRHLGFGSELIEERIPYELDGRGKVRIEDGGAQCHLEFPLKEGASFLETGAPRPAIVFGGVTDMTGQSDLTGQRVLVVEDDYYLASDTARALRAAGAEVIGPTATEEDARAKMAATRPTWAILDINLRGGRSFELAGDFARDGIPFLFLTGYDQDVIPERFDGVTRLQKPVELRHIVDAVAATTAKHA